MRRQTLFRILFICIGTQYLGGCGGVLDSTVTHRLDVIVGSSGKAVTNRGATVAIRIYRDGDFDRLQPLVWDTANKAHAVFLTRWGRAFLLIPPVGSFPSHPPKPIYRVTIAGKEKTISPDLIGASYHWENGWHTRASIVEPP